MNGFSLMMGVCITSFLVHATAEAAPHTVTVNTDGTYNPAWLDIHDGDTVTWQFPDRRRAIVRVHPDGTSFPAWCTAYRPYDSADPNEFTGPMPVAASGVFALGPDDSGALILPNTPAAPCYGDPAVNGKLMCDGAGDLYAPLQELLDSPHIVGVFLRPHWNTVETSPGGYYWDDLDAQIQRVVAAGKLYSLSFKAGKSGTPKWLNRDLGLPLYNFDRNVPPGSGASCGIRMTLANPTDPLYSERYADFLRAVGAHIRANPAHYRALAYIKPSGANYTSHENRLPNTCDPGCTCNTAVWAGAGYTPAGLYDFYSRQTHAISKAFPGKSMSYQLIQAGFPQVANATDFLGCPNCGSYPNGTEQTNFILDEGQRVYGTNWVVQHNGLNTKPLAAGTCLNENVHPVQKPVFPSGSHCPNPYVLREGAEGQVTGFQTVNLDQVNTLPDLDSTLLNALDNSDAVFVEVYERLLWEADELGLPLNVGAATPRTLSDWNKEFRRRRRDAYFTTTLGLDDPYPMNWSHTFTRTIGAVGAEIYHYVDPAVCGTGPIPEYGAIRILP
jgi:hypothetical protein